MSGRCLLCGAASNGLLALGDQPISSHYLAGRADRAPERPLTLGRCPSCGTIQLLPPFPNESLTPPYSWITYREPEDHLDHLVDAVAALPGLSRDSRIAGVSFKDQSTLDRFGRKGFEVRWCLDARADLGAAHPYANIESVPSLLTEERARAIVAQRGPADVVFARHVLEHAAEPSRLLAALAALLREGGYLVLEVPDNEKNIVRQDYTMIWEEHALYFTAESFSGVLAGMPLSPVLTATYPYRFEDVLVTVARKQTAPATRQANSAVRDDAAIRGYAEAFPEWSRRYRAAIGEASGGKLAALYGA